MTHRLLRYLTVSLLPFCVGLVVGTGIAFLLWRPM